jgi:hypothetical protein
MAMRDPSFVAAKADTRQQAIKGGAVPIGDTLEGRSQFQSLNVSAK